jgi:small conductance mechanosensitive channel
MNSELLSKFHPYVDTMISYLPGLIKAFLTFVIGFWLAKRVDKILIKYFNGRHYDISLGSFVRSLVNIGIKIIVLITVAGMIGLPTTSLVAVFGAAGLAIGLALQGSLSNFAGGVLILIFKPFKVGDLITCQGESGQVMEIQIFNTIMITGENKTVILPNGAVSNGTIINVSKQGSLRVDIKVMVDFNEDIHNIRKIILEVLKRDELILKDPVPTVNIVGYAESAIILSIRPYATPDHFTFVQFNAYENIHQALIENGIKGPQIKRVMVQE